MSHGDYFDEPERILAGNRQDDRGELLLFQNDPFMDYDLVDGYHYGQLAIGPYKERWVRLGASPVDMGLVRQ